ncbi:MAG TPA: O-antigen ligase family protein, partial [Thermoanaerobaculia bacterium]|nr:O-antigen ligase family protein [Thermoanaerobaculia bacterium]
MTAASGGARAAARLPTPALEESRRPSTAARAALLFTAIFGYAVALSVAFPPGAPDRLPVLVLSILLALVTAQRWSRGARLFALLFPCAGILARAAGGADPAAWPTLLFAGFACGWTFRFLYDFDTRADPSGPDAALRALLALWAVSTLMALVEARTLWALARGLSGRAVNGEGLPESTAVRESLLSFGALASGGFFFLVMRRCGERVRQQTIAAALVGATLSASAALLQRISLLPAETHPFWRMTGRFSGGAVDPNALGMSCALALSVAATGGASERRLSRALFAIPLLLGGLLLSGSRSGLLLLAGSLLLFVIFRRRTLSPRALGLVGAAAAALVVLVILSSTWRGSVGSRFALMLDPSRSAPSRVSSRPALWDAAWRLFLDHPIAGGGMGVFSWRLPDLLHERGARLPARDNPGSAYFQALSETGLLGLFVTLLFAVSLGRDAISRLTRAGGEGFGAASAAAGLGFLAVLTVGSHWLAADTNLLFCLLASAAALPEGDPPPFPRRAWLRAAVVLYAAAAAAAVIATARPEEAFRYGTRIGFYPRERGTGGEFQWTRQNFALWLRPGERTRLALAQFSPLGGPVEISANAGGRPIYHRALAPGGIVTLDLIGGASRPAAVSFALSRSFVP